MSSPSATDFAPSSARCAPALPGFVGQHPAFLAQVSKLPRYAACPAGVLIQGETGTGKEVFAQAIHYLSPRAPRPWVAVNCGAIPVDLLESELFGHVRGAYTSAQTSRHGLVAEAEGGTLFLDDIDCLPLPAQAKLLRFLQEHEYRAVGSNTVRHADVRVVAASNRPLREMAQQGAFREDLYYRLNVLALSLPPLRERAADIPLLATHFLQRYGGAGHTLSAGAQARLMAHRWPGNVRELAHVVERAALLARSDCLRSDDIEIDGEEAGTAPFEAEGQDTAAMGQAPAAGLSLRDAKARLVQDFERRYIEELLSRHAGNVTHAAVEAGKNRRAFFELMRRYRIESSSFRAPH
ncbi:sigma-54 interaction domain-containing protein [Rubrivivax rivuli]|uniref:Sigma-54-dependent Fis family transcriptional regulator n=1 Tax=Rubrivivax rivuli TaxID=1862385 RepID=A0A437RHQ9_9BURK|nr:sigma-54 dependent transcriptional regulator [Rubrivivax rivuli]RVU46208.1 sigma-54-dependent Fis family transcriptional regulator [Rubrivivax rivuli]